jgi:hypothetical protein
MADGRSDTAGRLLPLSRDLHRLTARCVEPAWTTEEAERRIAEGERVAAAIRAVFRGGPVPQHKRVAP